MIKKAIVGAKTPLIIFTAIMLLFEILCVYSYFSFESKGGEFPLSIFAVAFFSWVSGVFGIILIQILYLNLDKIWAKLRGKRGE
jgi:hypothetical protein